MTGVILNPFPSHSGFVFSTPHPILRRVNFQSPFSPMWWACLPSTVWGLAPDLRIDHGLRCPCMSSLQTTVPGLFRACLTQHPDLPMSTEHIPAHLSFSRSSSLIAPRMALDVTCPNLLFQGHLLCLLGCPPWPPAPVGFPLAHGLGSHLGGQACQSATASSQALLLPSASY